VYKLYGLLRVILQQAVQIITNFDVILTEHRR